MSLLYFAPPFSGPAFSVNPLICLVKQNDGTWVEKDQCFLFNVYKLFFIFVTFLRFLTFFLFFIFIFLERFFISMVNTG